MNGTSPPRGALHHVELWVPDLARALPRWSWLLGELGHVPLQAWEGGASFRLGATYLVLEQSPALVGERHERLRPGLNHLAFHAGRREQLDALVAASAGHGWRLLFPEQHPFAGGPDHCAAYLEDEDGYEVELVAS
ncbi:VOC family protein [Quadrisphaera oryzae]|uniref:VOC family protein n=1 Tax=Quadrisphaera TaxID=317661 RepID=UPI001647ED98|nr:VOC family protein [Quadrisphaera sp. RL12-1S]